MQHRHHAKLGNILAVLSFVSVTVASVMVVADAARAADDPSSEEFFEKRVRPVLAGACFRCHGDPKVSGGLRVDSRDALAKGGESGPALDASTPAQSLLLRAIRREDDVSAMPPDKPLSDAQRKDVEAWIVAGARWPPSSPKFEAEQHWAFAPLSQTRPPEVRTMSAVRTNVDRFLLQPLEAAGRTFAPPADRRTLLRRAAYDLTGLPPTYAEIKAFEDDASPDAFEKVIERLLESRAYGEHWGRHWLDVVRYADTAGENSDHPLPHAWRYRNWVIDSFWKDRPYDEFIRAQIAGDLLAKKLPPEQAAEHVIATGYLAIARRFGHDIDKDMHLTIEDTIDTLGKSVLGLSLGCCRCHDHKYDPLTALDYYGLYGIFDSTRYAFPGCEPKQQPRDLVPLVFSAEQEQLAKGIDAQIAELDRQIKEATDRHAADAKRVQDAAAAATRVLSEALVEEGKSVDFSVAAKQPLDAVAVRRGDVLQLVVSPRGNHGADSTLVEWTIATVGGEPHRWRLADLASDLLAGNPHADAYGHESTWCFLDAREGPQLLSESRPKIDGREELQAWHRNDTPSVFVNRGEQPVKVWTELPPKSFFVHPGPNGPVAVAWISPVDAVVRVEGRVADAHPASLDGVSFSLQKIEAVDYGAHLASLGQSRATQTALAAQRTELAAMRPVIPVAYAVAEGTPHDARLHKRGEPADLGDPAPRKFLDVLGGQKLQATDQSGRLELAQWLTGPDNPLTPRVIANRVWQWHFGRGLVSTPNDFGVRGAPPTHPELLDYLAGELVRSGWSLKHLHREIMRSAAYQQSSASSENSGRYDSFPRRRLTAEELRDSLLAASGELDLTPGEAHPFPPESTWSFSQHGPFAAEYDTLKRSVYVMQKRNRRTRYFALFDGPDPNASTPVRDVTTVPTQALFFLNDPFLHARAAQYAQRLLAETPDDERRETAAYERLFGRPPTDSERRDMRQFRTDYVAMLGDLPESERALAAWEALSRILMASNEVLHVD
ncbi:MAG: PSD1 and planctomycete cytochrome C domain-containing protein [Pirellulales bacterium]